MPDPYIYRVLRTSWGVWVQINCEVQTLERFDETGAIKINDAFYLAIAQNARVPDDEIPYLVKGVELVAEELKDNIQSLPAAIYITECTLVLTDYQPEGLTYAIAGWLTREYGLNWKAGEVVFDKENNRYIFPFTL